MSPVIRISYNLTSGLKACPGGDTPANVIERLLGHYEEKCEGSSNTGNGSGTSAIPTSASLEIGFYPEEE